MTWISPHREEGDAHNAASYQVASMWTSNDMSWLDGNCKVCSIQDAKFTLSQATDKDAHRCTTAKTNRQDPSEPDQNMHVLLDPVACDPTESNRTESYVFIFDHWIL